MEIGRGLAKALQTVEVQWEEQLWAAKKRAVKDFRTSIEYDKALIEFAVESYLQGMVDCRAKVQGPFPRLALNCLNA